MKKIAFSGIQPSGIIHIGNYLGAIAQWVENQDKYQNIFSIVDLHAITMPQDPKTLKEATYLTAATYLASGINPKKSIIFVQSHVPAHSELGWILTSLTTISQLNRMTQFKNKSGLINIEKLIYEKTLEFKKALANEKEILRMPEIKEEGIFPDYTKAIEKRESIGLELIKTLGTHWAEFLSIKTGLLIYPALMAADILLYKANVIPVGNDQKQHVELTRDLAQRFNHKYGKVFIIPEPLIKKSGARIMGLDNPENKMSKSATNFANYIAITDKPEIIRKKIMRAVTDSGKTIKFDTKRKGLYNLLTIYKIFSGKTESQIEKHFKNKGFRDFKIELADLVIEKLAPIQTKIAYYMKNKKLLDKILANGAKQANKIANKTLAEVRQKIGLIETK